ncbi:unnamed protein product [Onchocerca flexuosa]|uniref:Uncharacterized protein n=1 Tax=Onchocerca flexuosa TaxID=387005 RepID=A0A183HSM8_9BILA|nr:unnamed protein product [Onchocerca flexuosa]
MRSYKRWPVCLVNFIRWVHLLGERLCIGGGVDLFIVGPGVPGLTLEVMRRGTI